MVAEVEFWKLMTQWTDPGSLQASLAALGEAEAIRKIAQAERLIWYTRARDEYLNEEWNQLTDSITGIDERMAAVRIEFEAAQAACKIADAEALDAVRRNDLEQKKFGLRQAETHKARELIQNKLNRMNRERNDANQRRGDVTRALDLMNKLIQEIDCVKSKE